jgi:hypothetical protein
MDLLNRDETNVSVYAELRIQRVDEEKRGLMNPLER